MFSCGARPLADWRGSRRFLRFYKDIGAVLYPVLPDLSKLERDTHQLLQNRLKAGGVYRPDMNGLVKPFGMSLPFLSLLFVVLASGCQLSDLPLKERELTSWVYGVCATPCSDEKFYGSHVSLSVVFLPVLANDQLCIAADSGSNTNPYLVSGKGYNGLPRSRLTATFVNRDDGADVYEPWASC